MSRSILKDGQYFGESAVLASTKQVFGSQIASRRILRLTRFALQPSSFTAVATDRGAELYVLPYCSSVLCVMFLQLCSRQEQSSGNPRVLPENAAEYDAGGATFCFVFIVHVYERGVGGCRKDG